MNSKLKWMVLAGAVVFGSTQKAMAANPVDGSITVTPVANVSLALAPTTYAFGNVAVAISSVSVSSLTLTNDGQVTVTVDKRIQTQSAPAGWTAGTAAALDTYVLYVGTATAQPGPGEFAVASRLGAEANVTALTGVSSVTPTITPANAVDLWFKLDMPTAVTAQTARTITVRFTGTAQ